MKKIIQVLSLAILFAFSFSAKSQTSYTYIGTGDLNTATNWTNTVGGNPAAMPTGSADTWNFVTNGSSLGVGSFTVSANSTIVIGDGTNTMSFNTGTDTSQFVTDDGSQSVNLIVNNHATFVVLTTDFFSSYILTNTFNTGSIVNYALSGAFVNAGNYYDLTISQNASLAGNTITVVHTFSNSSVLTMAYGSITLYGTVSGTGTFNGNTGSTIDVESSSPITLNFKSGGGQTLQTLKLGNNSVVTLGTNLKISGGGIGVSGAYSVFNQANGSLKLNSQTLTLDTDNDATFGDATHVITGGTTSGIVINSVTFGGGGSIANFYMDQTSSTTNSLKAFTMNGANFLTLNLKNQLNIIDSISPISGGLNTNGNLTLIANQSNPSNGACGRIGTVGGTGIAGNINSQVWHNPTGNQTNWMLMGSPGIDNPTFNDWNSNFVITCPSCPISTVNGTVFNSVQSYNEASGTTFGDALHYNPISGLGSTINPGQGYWVYLGTANPGSSISGELITVTGPAKWGAINLNLTNSNPPNVTDYGYNLVANPYPSTISWKKVMTINSIGGSAPENNVYAYSASYNGGDYVIYNASSGVSTPSTGSYTIGDQIPTALGFYVQTDQANRVLSLDESVKVKNTKGQIIFRESNPSNNSTQSTSSSNTHYFSLQVTGGTNESWAAISFNANATTGRDGFDAMAIGYNGALQVSSSYAGNNGKDYAINGLPDLTQNYTIPVKILSGTTAQYQVNPKDLQNMLMGACLILHDNYTGTDYDLRSGPFNVTINDSETVARFVLNVTLNQLAITTNVKQATCSNNNDGLLTAVGNSAGPWNYIWRDSQGNVVKTSLNKSSADTLSGLNNGVYSVEVNTQGSCDAALQSFTVTAPGAATSLFSAPTQISAGSTVTFTNSSTDATTYAWNFGDGSNASLQSPTYVYNNAGTYSVTLVANNTACNETSTSTQVIIVDATTGIKQAVAGSGNIFLSQDATGNYLQFNYASQTKVNITVYNVLGQTVLTNAGLNVASDKVYLNLNDSKNQVLYVTVTDLTSNIQTTKKFVNN